MKMAPLTGQVCLSNGFSGLGRHTGSDYPVNGCHKMPIFILHPSSFNCGQSLLKDMMQFLKRKGIAFNLGVPHSLGVLGNL